MKNPPDGFEAQLSLAGRFSALDELDRGAGGAKIEDHAVLGSIDG